VTRLRPIRSLCAAALLSWIAATAHAATPKLVQAMKAGDREAALSLARDANAGNSWAIVVAIISASAPATSTPVGPPPTMTKS